MATNQGASNSDYSLSATSVTFGPTETSKTFTFTATQDSVDDDEESVELGFGTLPGGVSAGLVPKTTVSINDDDDPVVDGELRALNLQRRGERRCVRRDGKTR